MDEAIAILKLCSHDWDALTVHALYDGDQISPWETVMTIEGDYTLFAHLETSYLGVLARRTLISTNVRRVVEAANGKPILFFPARHDHHRVQTGDGYAAHVAGAIGVSTDAQASWWGGRGFGTVPHALISAYGGNTVLAATKFAEHADPDQNIVVLVDFENDSVRTALEVARALGPQLWGVRLDTSRQLVDRSLWEEMGDFDPRGVNERLVWKVREALDADGFEQRQDRRLGRVRRRADPRVRAGGRPGGLLRRRLGAHPRRERLHRGRRPHRRAAVGQGRPPIPAESATRARRSDARTSIRSRRSAGRLRRAVRAPRPARRPSERARPTDAGACTGATGRSGTASRRSRRWGRSCEGGEEPGLIAYDGRSAGRVGLDRAARDVRGAAPLAAVPPTTRTRRGCGRSSASRWTKTRAARGVNEALLAAAVEHRVCKRRAGDRGVPAPFKRDDYMGHIELFRAHGFERVRETVEADVVRRTGS